MKNSDRVPQVKVDIMKKDLQAIAEKLRNLTSPISAMKIYIEGILEDRDHADIRDSLSGINTSADKCIEIIRELLALTMRYFDPEQDK